MDQMSTYCNCCRVKGVARISDQLAPMLTADIKCPALYKMLLSLSAPLCVVMDNVVNRSETTALSGNVSS